MCVMNKILASITSNISNDTIGMDNHADTSIYSSKYVVVEYTSHEYDITPYNSKDI